MRMEYLIGGIIVVALGAGAFIYLRAPSIGVASTPKIATTTPKARTKKDSTKIESASPALSPEAAQKAGVYPKAPELTGIDGYINTDGKPIKISDFIGKKVVLIDIWTYSCINCQRTLPYLKSWYDKYSDKGLEIIGVHTPEFSFEKVLKNVQDATAKEGIKYPVVLDNEYKTWNAFNNQYWPRKYLIDIDGYIVYDHAGEGDYDGAEKAIQKALVERQTRLGVSADVHMPITSQTGISQSDLQRIQSPETYFGSNRNDRFGNGVLWSEGDQTLTIPASIKQNAFYLSGTWNISPEFAANKTIGAQIQYQYNSKSVYFVAAADAPVKIKVTRDGGKPLGTAAGADVDTNGEVTISENRLYKIIEDSNYDMHTLEITIEGVGLKAYTFTFG